jgi:hypothetical protein
MLHILKYLSTTGSFSFLREGALGFYVLEHEAHVVGFGSMKLLLPFPPFMTTGILTCFIQPEYTHKSLGKNFSTSSRTMRKKWV